MPSPSKTRPHRAANARIIAFMTLDLRDLVGYAAATLTTAAFVPQVVKSWRTRDLSGVSLTMYGLFSLGVALWLAYGIILAAWPVIIANAITLVLAGGVLVLKLRRKKKGDALYGAMSIDAAACRGLGLATNAK
jgi:MtN3 and saliva related transmembrane protein